MIDLTKTDTVWIATLNRPDKANSLTYDMLFDLAEIAAEAQAAPGLILTGTGKVFSAGADLDEARAGLAKSDVWGRLSDGIAALPCLTVAALNGTLAGGAFGMALACDLRVAAPEANFFYPVMKNGFLPQPADPGRMSALIGPARTKLILMAGQKLNAETAFAFGLVDQICPREAVLDRARALFDDVSTADPALVAQIKSMCST